MITLLLPVPTIILPMDEILSSVLLGSITGIVTGAPTVAAGKVGGALHLNGINQNVNFGPYNPVCYHTIEMCPDGVTWAMWLKLEERESKHVILDTGGYFSSAQGYNLVRRTDGVFRVHYSNATHKHRLSLTYWDLGQWVYLVLVLHPARGASSMYLNGCMVGDIALSYSVWPNPAPISRYMPFVLGASPHFIDYSTMGIDNLLIWYDMLTLQEAWQLYLQGGEI